MAYFEPLRVRAHLRTGVVAGRWLPLDAILLYQASRDQLGDQTMTTPGGNREPDGIRMPLRVIHPGQQDWYYACSWAQPQPWWQAEAQDHWNKRFDVSLAHLVNFDKRRGKVIIEKGRYKAYHMPIFYRIAAAVGWYCLGDLATIEYLLSTVSHIGKKRSQGWGRVIAWTVEPWPHDWSVRRNGHLTRGVPARDARPDERHHVTFYGLRPAYYRRSNQMLVALPDG